MLECARSQLLRYRTGAGVENPPSTPVVAHRPHVADPPPLDAGEPRQHFAVGGELGVALEHFGDLDPGPIVGRRPPLPCVPVESPVRDRPYQLDKLTLVRKRQHHDPPALAVAAQLDVGALGGQLHQRK